MKPNTKIKIIEALIYFNTFDYDECKQTIEKNLEEEYTPHLGAILKILETIENIKNQKEFENQLNELYQLIEQIEEDNFNYQFKDLVISILEDIRSPYIGFPRKKLILNWQFLF